MTVIDFTSHLRKKRGEDQPLIPRLDEAYDQLMEYFKQMLWAKYAKDDVALIALVRFTADVVRIGRDRPACGAAWAQHKIENFVMRANMPLEK